MPAMAATLGLASLTPAAGQQRPALLPAGAEAGVALPATGPAVAPAPASPRAAHRGTLAAISSTATGGNWSSPATWVGGVVPTATDDVTIAAGATVTLDVAATAGSLTVAATGSLLTSATTAYSLQVAGSVTNNGTLDLSASATIGSDLRFTGAGSVTFGGTGSTDLQTVSLAKSVRADVVDMVLPSFTVQGSATTTTGFLSTRITTNTVDDMTGTLKISGTNTANNRVFINAASYVIPATGGFWLNNPNFTVAAQTGSPTVNGLLRISTGTYNVGVSIGNSINFGTSAAYTQEGGTMNVVGRFTSFTSASAAAAMTFIMSGGTLNASTVGNTSGTPSFGVNGTTTISGGTINLVQRSTATTPLDYYVAGTYTYTGGTVNVGTAATATNFDFRVRGTFPNLTIDNTTNPKTAVLQGQTNVYGTTLITPGANLNLSGQLLLQLGAAVTNNGILTGTTAGSTLYFAGSAPQTLSGTGTATTIRTITLDNNGGGVTLAMPLTVTRVNMFTGNLSGGANLTVGDGTALFFVIQIGVTGNTGTSGSITAAPTFNIGTGALQLIYAPELTARTTGFEIPATRVVDALTISNPAGVTLAGGNLVVNASGVSTGSLTLSSGILTTSAANKLTLGTAAATIPTGSATSYVRGPLGITVNSATAVSRTFAVGDATGWRPVVVTGITAATDQVYTATVVAGATNGTGLSPVTNLNPTRYVRLENTANLPASARVQLSYGADDVLGNAATAIVAQAIAAGGVYFSLGGAAATTPTTGLVSTLDLSPGSDFFVLANTEGGVLTSSATAPLCAGANSGSITLTGNVGTIVNYELTTGAGFSPVSPVTTTATLNFSNLTVTTTYRAVVLTTDGRQVFSTPVVVVVAPAPTATLTTTTPTTFCQGGSVVLTAPAGTGNTYQFLLNGTAISGATAATYTATASGAYSVTVTNAGGCSATSAATTVTVNPATTATFAYSGATFCASGTNPTATVTGTAGGTFASTTGLSLNATTGAINLAASTPGTYTVTYSVGGTCPSSATAAVTITAAPVAAFSYPTATTYCAGSASTVTPSLGTGATAGTFSAAAGLAINATTGVISLATSTAGTYTVTNTVAAANGCAATTATTSVTVTPAASAAFTYSGTTFCVSGATAPAATVTGTAGGTFTSTTGLTLNATTGAITLASSTPGAYTVTYTVAGACGATATAAITITAPQAATFSYGPTTTYCVSGTTSPAVVLGTGATAGAFTSTTGLSLNATTGAITLASSTPGTYTVTNTVAAASGCAAATATTTVTITAAPVATFSYATTAGCAGSTSAVTPTLGTGATAGAFTSATGLSINATTGAINLATSTAGTYTVTNTLAAANGCAAATATATFTVNPRPAAPTLTAIRSGSTTTLTSSAATGNQFYLNGTAVAGATGQTYVVNGAAALLGSYTVTTTNANGCVSLPSAVVVVTSSVKPLAGSTLSVFPNPTRDGKLSVELTGYRKAVELTVLNALGQVVFTATVPAATGTTTQAISLTALPSGIYILRAKTEGGLDTRRITKE
jgi:hypothetical protein